MFLISTRNAEHIAKKLEDKADVLYIASNKDGKNIFPDGELYVRIPDVEKVRGKRTMILHSGMPSPNESLLELESVLEILNYNSPSSIEVFFLYYPFGMQDKIFLPGEINMAEHIAKKLVDYYNVSRIYTIDVHFHSSELMKKYPFVDLSAEKTILDKMKEDGIDINNIVCIAPDMNSQKRLGIEGFEKERENSYTISIKGREDLNRKVKGKTVAVWDDLIETGGTMARAIEEIQKMNAKEIIAVATHGVLQEGIEKVRSKCSKLYLTDTINTKYANVDISGLVANIL